MGKHSVHLKKFIDKKTQGNALLLITKQMQRVLRDNFTLTSNSCHLVKWASLRCPFVTISRKGWCKCACGNQGDIEGTRPILERHLFNTLLSGKCAFSSFQEGALRFADHVIKRSRSCWDKVVNMLCPCSGVYAKRTYISRQITREWNS